MEKYCWFKEDERTHEKKQDAKSEQKTNRIISDRNTEYKEEEKCKTCKKMHPGECWFRKQRERLYREDGRKDRNEDTKEVQRSETSNTESQDQKNGQLLVQLLNLLNGLNQQ